MRRGALALLLVASGCEARLALGAPCVRTSECPEPFACLAGRCRTECASARDCPYPLECLALGGGALGCRVVEEGSCREGTSDCAAPLECEGGVCRQRCLVAEDCAPGLVCDLSACTTPEPITGTGACDPTATATGCAGGTRCALGGTTFSCVAEAATSGVGAPCTGQLCADGLVCAGSRCVRPCRLPDQPGCTGTACDGTSCGEDRYCDVLSIGMPEGALPPELPDGLGYCSERCDAFADEATDGCPEGTACGVAIPDGNFYLWCRPLVAPFRAPYESCMTSAWDCPFGTICEVVSTGPRLCRPFCVPGSSDCEGGRPCAEVTGLGIGLCGDL